MEINKIHIIDILERLPFLETVKDCGEEKGLWTLMLKFATEDKQTLVFNMCVNLYQSPMKLCGNSPVRFSNPQLIEYPHIMHAGSLCMQTRNCVTWEDRILEDINALHEWILKFYVNKELDEHYEDLVVEDVSIKGRKKLFYYSQLDTLPPIGEYGMVAYTKLTGSKCDNKTDTYLVQALVYGEKRISSGEWSDCYSKRKYEIGLFAMLNGSPSVYDKFAIENYADLQGLCSEKQLEYLYGQLYRSGKDYLPIFWGYQTPSGKLRWLITYPNRNMPFIKGEKHKVDSEVKWIPKLTNVRMEPAATEGCSYDQFFGRGGFHDSFADKKVLLLGVGAIGSIVATTLIRCGIKDITLSDYDDKHSGNICRSEYLFDTGKTKKIDELKQILQSISPFVKVTEVEDLHIVLKQTSSLKLAEATKILDMFDIVFDCSIDSEMMWAIDKMATKAQVINLSISNEAKELVCAFSPNVSEFVSRVYTDVIKEGTGDMYNPEGCWSPTFKASYNDVQVMVQYALRNIVKMLSRESAKANFMIREIDESLKLIRW